jgi:O-antigen/teichoic acid export membrane protein
MSTDESGRGSIASRTAKGAGWVIAWRLATRNIGLLSTLVLVRLLDPTDFGLIALATGFIAAAEALSSVGVADALIRERKPDRAMYDTAFTLSVLRGLLTAALILGFAVPVASFFSEDRLVPIMLALSIGMIITSVENIGIVDFRRDLAFHKEFQLQVWSRLASVATTITMAFILRDYWALIVGPLVGRVIRVILSYVMSPYRPRFSLTAWRQLAGFSLWTWGVAVLVQARDRSDHAIVGRILGTDAVGTYAVGHEIGTLTTTELVEPLNRALFSGFASQQESPDKPGVMFLAAIGVSAVIVLPAGVGISMIAHPLVHLILGAQWTGVIGVIEVISVVSTLSMLTAIGSAYLTATGGVHTTFWLLLQSFIVRVPLMIACITQWGLVGAAIGAGLSLAIDQCVSLWVVLPRIEVRARQVVAALWRPVTASAAMAAALLPAGLAWTPSPDPTTMGLILDLGTRSLTGAAVYLITMTALWFLVGRPSGAERHILTMIRKRLRRT